MGPLRIKDVTAASWLTFPLKVTCPWLISKIPLKFAPTAWSTVSVPEPDLMILALLFVLLLRNPEKVRPDVWLMVSTAAEPRLIVPPVVPPPLSEPMVSVTDAPNERVGLEPELAKVTADVSPMALPPETCNVPPEMVVVPVK